MGEYVKMFPRDQFLALIRQGHTDTTALAEINSTRKPFMAFQPATLVQCMVKDIDFKEAVDSAKRDRADVWFDKIVESQGKANLSKEDVPVEKLQFEQRKYLAAIDNPEKYAERTKNTIDFNLNIFQEMKDMPLSEARKLLASADPFVAEFEVIEDAASAHPGEANWDPDGLNTELEELLA